MVNFPATGAGFSSITSVRERIERLSPAGRLTRIPIGTIAASSARRGASSVTRPEPSRIGRFWKISPLMLFQVSSEGCVDAGAASSARTPDAAAKPSAIITERQIVLTKFDTAKSSHSSGYHDIRQSRSEEHTSEL